MFLKVRNPKGDSKENRFTVITGLELQSNCSSRVKSEQRHAQVRVPLAEFRSLKDSSVVFPMDVNLFPYQKGFFQERVLRIDLSSLVLWLLKKVRRRTSFLLKSFSDKETAFFKIA